MNTFSFFSILPLVLFSLPCLYSKNTSIKEYSLMIETSGNYPDALQNAKQRNESPETIKRLETCVLNLGYSTLFFDEKFNPKAKLIQLLEIVGMENPRDLIQINDWAQKNLLRNGERWQKQTEKFEALKSTIEPLLIELGFTKEVPAHFSSYEGAILHGCLLSRARTRLAYLAKQWEEGVRFSDVYFLTGARPLDPKKEDKENLLKIADPLKIRQDWIPPTELPQTEAQMMEFIWDQSELPEDMRKQVKVHCVNVPMKQDPKTGKIVRPTTNDTIELWLKNNPLEGCYLVISTAPYVPRQDVVMRTIAPENFSFDTIGSSLDDQEPIAIVLDEVARLIFQTKQLSEKKR